MKLHKVTVFCLALFLTGTISVFALDIIGEAPTFEATTTDPILTAIFSPIVGQLNNEVRDAFNKALNEIRDEFGGISPKPEKLLQAFGNSAVFASHGATQRGYAGYNLLTVTAGPMIGLKLPSSPFTIMDEIDGLVDNLMDEGDIEVGISPQMLNFQVGLNTSKFLLKNLYLGLRFGYIKLDNVIENFTFNNFMIGATANYQILPSVSLAKVIVWRGVNVGSGLIYQSTKVGFSMPLDTISESIVSIPIPSVPGFSLPSSINPVLKIDPKLGLEIDISTVTVPLEAMTAIKLLGVLNIAFGVGADLGFGTSEMKAGMDAPINITGIDSGIPVQQKNPGNVSVTAGGSMAPSVFNMKLMTGIGFNVGPVLLDIPVTFYIGNGYNIGVTLGVTL